MNDMTHQLDAYRFVTTALAGCRVPLPFLSLPIRIYQHSLNEYGKVLVYMVVSGVIVPQVLLYALLTHPGHP